MEYTVSLSYFLVLQVANIKLNPLLIRPSLIIVALFLASIFFRQIDMVVCHWIGFGTHFMWHILNAMVLFLFVKILYKD